MSSTVTSKSTIAAIRSALAAAGIEAPAKANKAALLDLLHPETALDVAPAAAVEAPAAVPAPAKRASKNATVVVNGATVRFAAWTTVHNAEGQRVAILRRSALAALGDAEASKVMRVQTEYSIAGQPVGWVRNGTTVAAVGKIIGKALATK